MRGGLLFLLFFSALALCAQNDFSQSASASSAIDERLIAETKWKYTYSLHLESNTVIHKAADHYEFFLYFRYNYSTVQYLNGKLSRRPWVLSGNELLYRFKNVERFFIAELNKEVMVLEFKQPNSKGTYQYHFMRVDTENAPFVKPPNELPDVNVEAMDPRKNRKSWFSLRTKKRQKEKKKRKNTKRTTPDPYICIELIGGGYYGGIDPVLRDYILIKNDGRLIKEFKSVHNGLIVTKKNIPRAELEQFAEYIVSQNFFNLERIYDCETSNCYKRKKKQPAPIPLRLAIAYGSRRKVITISVWGKDEHAPQYIDYPDALDNIIETVQKMAHRVGS